MELERLLDAMNSSPPEAATPVSTRAIDSFFDHHDQGRADNGDDYDLPSYDDRDRNSGEQKATKAKYLIHDPEHEDPMETVFVTQLTQNQYSSPSKIRGPRWRKKAPSPPPASQGVRVLPPKAMDRTQPEELRKHEYDDPALEEAFNDSDIEELDATLAASMGGISDGSRRPLHKSRSFRQQTLFGAHAEEVPATQSRVYTWPLVRRDETPTHHKLDLAAMKTWVYPTNLGKPRDYQFNIVQRGLYHNLLVALPTGLGKTFIAAAIMLNWFRWTQDAQLVFVAPTKPLVHQQVDACFNVAGIPRSQTTMLTGEVAPAVRAEEWNKKRVFFMTPQTLINDYKHGYADPKRIVLLVVDEAHRATGSYAYVEVVQFLRRFNTSFRILALTATPGATIEAVQKVIDGLDIARVEIRTEQSLDIREYVHTRNLEIELFEYSDEINLCLELFSGALKPVQDKLVSQNAFWGKDPLMNTVYGLNQARAQWMRSEAGRKAQSSIKGMVNTIFTVLMSLAHALTLLKFHGIGPFYHKLKAFQDESTKGKYALQIKGDENFKKLMGTVKTWINNPDFVGHPKLLHLESVVLNHFMDAGEGTGRAGGRPPSETRIMVFAHYRDSAEEIVRVLKRHKEMIRPKVFVGQASAKGSEGMQQKNQLAAIKDFKEGVHNVLVATSVGEEGLDIGEVDLIVCYDASASPIRMLQRMGRTGRKRTGNIEVLLMRGKEENDFTKSRDSYEKMQVIIANGKDFNFHEKSARIVPREIEPAVDKRLVDIPFENTQAGPIQPVKKAKKSKPKKKFHIPYNAEKGFQTAAGKKINKAILQMNQQAATSSRKLDAHTATLPSLDSVLLTAAEDKFLDETYCQISGENPQFVQPPKLHAPSTQRKLQPVVKVLHSSLTSSLIAAFDSMRNPPREWTRPIEFDFNQMVESPVASYAETGEENARRPSKKRKRPMDRSSTLALSGTVTDENAYDLKDGFIDDGELERTVEDELENEVEELSSSPRTKPADAEHPYFVSQQSIATDDDDENDELPEFNTLICKESSLSTAMPIVPKQRKKRPAQRVLDDDSDD